MLEQGCRGNGERGEGETKPRELAIMNPPNAQRLKDWNRYLKGISPATSKWTDMACGACTPPKLREQTACCARGPAAENSHTISARREMARNQALSKHHKSYSNNANRVVLNAFFFFFFFAWDRERANTRQAGSISYMIVRLTKDSW